MDQLPRLGKRELICLLLFTCNYVVFVRRSFLFLWVHGMDYVILLWHSLSLPYNYFEDTSVKQFAPDNFVWNEPSKLKFLEAFSSQVIQQKLDKLQNTIKNSDHNADELVGAITDIIISAGDMSLPRKTFKKKKKKSHKVNKQEDHWSCKRSPDILT